MSATSNKRERDESGYENPHSKIARKDEDEDGAFDVFGGDDESGDDNDSDVVDGAAELDEAYHNQEGESEDDMDSEDAQEDYGDPIREASVTVEMDSKSYTFEMALFDDPRVLGAQHVMSQVHYLKDQKETSEETLVGYLDSVLLPRPNSNFHQMARNLNSELQELACMFCDSRGIANRIDTGASEDAARGGFLHIFAIEIGKGHQGKCDLGLRLVHETLLFLRGDWTLAVMVPLLLGVDIQRWPEENNRLKIDPTAGAHSQEQHDGLREAHMKIKRHFSRMGFCQAGRNSEHHLAWFLAASKYFGDDANKGSGNDATAKWKSKEEAPALDIFVAPAKHFPEGLDEELHSLINEDPVDLVVQVEKLVEKGASLHDSRALFLASADCVDTKLLQLLIKLGGKVNQPDENGNTPLHVASTMMQPKAIEFLIANGASLEARNDKQHNAMETAKEYIATMDDFQPTWDHSIPQIAESLNVLDCVLLLMPESLKNDLIDSWLPPRMREMFSVTAETVANSLKGIQNDIFDSGKTLPLETVDDKLLNSTLFSFLPPSVFDQNSETGFTVDFFRAWVRLFELVSKILERKEAPTVAALETSMNSCKDEFQEYIDCGGKAEYALDALVVTTRQSFVGDDKTGSSVDDEHKKNTEQHVETPLDGLFDLARAKLLQLDPDAPPEQLGPYDHTEFSNKEPEMD